MTEETKKVLVIDDSQSSRYLYKTALSQIKDCHVLLAGTLKDGLKLFHQLQPELIILDIDLPDGTGVDFLKDIRSKNSSAKVIVISAIRSSDVIIQSAKLGIGTYLIKPVDINRFLKQVRSFLEDEE